MRSKKTIIAEANGLNGLRSLVEVYEEIAATRMQQVRGAVLTSRQFLDDLMQVFGRIKNAYKKESNFSALGRNGKTVVVFISANSGLFGDIVDRTFDKFNEYISGNECDVVVVGKLGVKMLADRGVKVLYNYFDFSDDSVDLDSFAMIMRYLIQFERILVFYGRFRSILIQDPTLTYVSGESLEYKMSNNEKPIQYLFEPSAMDIAKIFEGQILASIFEQTLHESQLAKFASRMLNLDRAVDSVDRRLSEISLEQRKVKHNLQNKKQLTKIAGINLWR